MQGRQDKERCKQSLKAKPIQALLITSIVKIVDVGLHQSLKACIIIGLALPSQWKWITSNQGIAMPAKKTSSTKEKAKPKYTNIPTALLQSHIDDLDAIAKAEEMTRSEVVRRAIESFAVNYKTDQLDQRQIQLEKQMKAMEKAVRALLVKSIRLNGQVLYFATLPWTQGVPKSRLNEKAFQDLYEKSAAFSAQFLKSKAAGLLPAELEIAEQQLQSGQSIQPGQPSNSTGEDE